MSDDFAYHWTRKMSFDDKTVNYRLTILEGGDFWTNGMMIEALRDLADEIEEGCRNIAELGETPKDVDH